MRRAHDTASLLSSARGLLGVGREVAELRAQVRALRRVVLGLQTFEFRGATYTYEAFDYNTTWANERAVELAIARRAVEDAGTSAILELGNVLRHYFPALRHRVVDKYEHGPGVENVDVLDVAGTYDLIVSISTLEHVGHDAKRGVGGAGESATDASAVGAIEHLRGCLAPGGRLLFTVPLGYNAELDAAIGRGIDGVETAFLRRLDRENRWAESGADEVAGATYGRPFPAANALVVGEAGPRPA